MRTSVFDFMTNLALSAVFVLFVVGCSFSDSSKVKVLGFIGLCSAIIGYRAAQIGESRAHGVLIGVIVFSLLGIVHWFTY